LVVGHLLEMNRRTLAVREHPSRILYDKQVEFFDSLAPLLEKLKEHTTAIDVWLEETAAVPPERLKEVRDGSSCVAELDELLQRYCLYLPAKVLGEGQGVVMSCHSLLAKPGARPPYQCLGDVFAFENTVREFVGVDQLSQELQQVLKQTARPSERD
jgi:hypothetical protein